MNRPFPIRETQCLVRSSTAPEDLDGWAEFTADGERVAGAMPRRSQRVESLEVREIFNGHANDRVLDRAGTWQEIIGLAWRRTLIGPDHA